MPNKSNVRELITDEARKYLGVKWRHQGRTVHGLDCIGLLARVGIDLGLACESKDHKVYPRIPSDHFLIESLIDTGCNFVGYEDRREGDILIFKQKSLPCHCGILSKKYNQFHIIHSHMFVGKVIEEQLSKEWDKCIIQALSFPRIK